MVDWLRTEVQVIESPVATELPKFEGPTEPYFPLSIKDPISMRQIPEQLTLVLLLTGQSDPTLKLFGLRRGVLLQTVETDLALPFLFRRGDACEIREIVYGLGGLVAIELGTNNLDA